MINFIFKLLLLCPTVTDKTLCKWSQGFWTRDSCFHLNSMDKTRSLILTKDVKIRDNVFVQVWTVAFFFFLNQFGPVVLGVNIFVFILLGIHLTSQVLRTFLHDFFKSFSASFSFLSYDTLCMSVHTHDIVCEVLFIFLWNYFPLSFRLNDFCWSIFKFIWIICQFKYFVDLSSYFFISVTEFSKSRLSFFPGSFLWFLFPYWKIYFIHCWYHFINFLNMFSFSFLAMYVIADLKSLLNPVSGNIISICFIDCSLFFLEYDSYFIHFHIL